MKQLFRSLLHGRVCLQEGEAPGEIAEVPRGLSGPPASPPGIMEMFSQKCQETPSLEPFCARVVHGAVARRWIGAARSRWHGSGFPMVKFKDVAWVTLPWGEG